MLWLRSKQNPTTKANLHTIHTKKTVLSTLIHDHYDSEILFYFQFDWKKYINLLFADTEFKFQDDTQVVVYAPEFLRKMAEKVHNTPPRVLANYLVWRITEYRVSNLPQAILDIENKFYRVCIVLSSLSALVRILSCNQMRLLFPVSKTKRYMKQGFYFFIYTVLRLSRDGYQVSLVVSRSSSRSDDRGLNPAPTTGGHLRSQSGRELSRVPTLYAM